MRVGTIEALRILKLRLRWWGRYLEMSRQRTEGFILSGPEQRNPMPRRIRWTL